MIMDYLGMTGNKKPRNHLVLRGFLDLLGLLKIVRWRARRESHCNYKPILFNKLKNTQLQKAPI
jgi:hypothetical protein